MARKLDRARTFGTIHGAEGRAAFEQDGLSFDAQGNQCEPDDPAPAPAGTPANDDAAFQAAVQAEVARQLAAAGLNKPSAEKIAEDRRAAAADKRDMLEKQGKASPVEKNLAG